MILNYKSDALLIDSATGLTSQWGWDECGSITLDLVKNGHVAQHMGTHEFYMPFRHETEYSSTGSVPSGNGATVVAAVSMTTGGSTDGYAVLCDVSTSGASGELARILLAADYTTGRIFGTAALSGASQASGKVGTADGGSWFSTPFPTHPPHAPKWTVYALSYDASTGDLQFVQDGVLIQTIAMSASAGGTVSSGTFSMTVGRADDKSLHADVFGVYYLPSYMPDASGEILQLTTHIQAELTASPEALAACPAAGALRWACMRSCD